MTIQNSSPIKSYVGNGKTRAFGIQFQFYHATDLRVYIDEILQVLNVDYQVKGGHFKGGDITFVRTPSQGALITILRETSIEQNSSFSTQGVTPASIERQLDLVTMQIQDLQDRLNRCLQLPATVQGVNTILPKPIGDKSVKWNSKGDSIINSDINLDDVPVRNLLNIPSDIAEAQRSIQQSVAAADKASTRTIDALNTAEKINKFATKKDIEDGTATKVALTPNSLRDAIGYSRSFTTPALSVAVNSDDTIYFGWGYKPKLVSSYLLCKRADLGYLPGQSVVFGISGGGRISIYWDENNLFTRVVSGPITLLNASHVLAALNPANWELYITIWG